jgi:hypothetical protein
MGTDYAGSGSAEFFKAILYGYINLSGRGRANAPALTHITQFRAEIELDTPNQLSAASFPPSLRRRIGAWKPITA